MSSAPAEVGADRTRRRDPPLAITFDFWNTLVVPDIAAARAVRRDAITDVLERHGIEVGVDVIDAVFDDTVEVFDRAWKANEQFTVEHAARFVLERFTDGLGPSARTEFVEAFVSSTRSMDVELASGVAEVLGHFHDRGVRLAVICDVGMTPSPILRGYLDRRGVLEMFDHLSFSDEVGVYKPAAEIFADALAGLGGVEPEAAAHVGDLLRTDVAGSRGFGMTSVRYRGIHDDRGSPAGEGVHGGSLDADHVVDDHAELLDVLDLH